MSARMVRVSVRASVIVNVTIAESHITALTVRG